MARRIVGRQAAGLPGPKRPRSIMRTPLGIALHYSGSLGDVRASHTQCPRVLLSWYNWHTRPGGLGVPQGGADIAYNWAICPHGYRFVLRGRRYQSGANGNTTANQTYYACCVMGGDRHGQRDVTPQTKDALLDLYEQIGTEIQSVRTARPHSYFASTPCPGDELRALLPTLQHILNKV